MRGLIFAVALLSASPAAAADIGALVGGKAYLPQGRDSLLALPGVDFGQETAEAFAVVDGAASGFRVRVRAEAIGAAASGWPGRASVRLKELSWSRPIGETWSLSAGKQLRSWDSGLAGQPLGFFHSGPDLLDPMDAEGRIPGLPMVVVTHLGERINAEALVSAPVGRASVLERLNRRQIALRVSGEPISGLNTALILRQREGTAPGAGFSISYGFGEVELHADGYYGAPEAAYVYAGLFDPAPVLHTASPFSLRAKGPASLRTVAGLTWSLTDRVSLSAEWSHDPSRASQAEWSRYLAGVDFHRAALTGPQAGLAFGNLAWDLGGRPGRPDQIYAGVKVGGDNLGYGISVLLVPADGSGVVNASLSWPIVRRTTLNVGLSALFGGTRSNFGVLPQKGSAQVSLTRAF